MSPRKPGAASRSILLDGGLRPVRSKRRGLPQGLRLCLRLTLALTAMSAMALAWYWSRGENLLRAQMWSAGPDRFGDLWHYYRLFRSFHTAAFFAGEERFAYPAPIAVVYGALYGCGTSTHLVFNVLLGLTALVAALTLYRLLRRYRVAPMAAGMFTAALLVTSYPLHTLYDRGNLELFVFIGVAGGVGAYLSNRPLLAAVLWGCAGALKLYPLVLLLVLLRRKTAWAFAAGLGTAAAVFVASCWYVGPSVAAAAMGSLRGVLGFLGEYAEVARRSELNQDHTILGALKEVLSLNILHLGESWPRLSLAYEAVTVAVAPLIYLRWVRRLPPLNQLCLLIVAMVLLPPVSYDYTLIHIYLVMGIVTTAYLSALDRGHGFRGTALFFAAFSVLATSQTWIELRGMRVNGILKCAALLSIGLLLLTIPLTIDSNAEHHPAAD